MLALLFFSPEIKSQLYLLEWLNNDLVDDIKKEEGHFGINKNV